MKKNKCLVLFALCLLFLLPAFSTPASAKDLDEILRYEITADVNDDATVRLTYHIDWKVLDSSSEGPLSWVKIGIPNSHYLSLTPRSAAVKRISYLSSGGSYVRVDLDRDYYAGEVAQIEFEVVQDYMYQVDEYAEGETVYHFTPGWYDDIRVDELTIRWSADRAAGQSPAALTEGNYLTWTTPLGKGEKFGVSVTYPNDAFGFDLSKTAEYGEEENDAFYVALGVIAFLIFFVVPIISVIAVVIHRFNSSANFSGGTKKKITRTRVEYYPACPGCGAPRPEGKDNCDYCGRSFIKSEEVIEEKDIPAEEKDLRGKTSDGVYRYHSQPNTYMRVHVTHVPVPRSSSSSRGGGSRSHSSCAHSSCACACACACAGGGRAGCSTKDFYNTELKLRQLQARR